ncbi:MAG: hypothetical protein JSV09_01375 [Thermoplasmata archaeon]|nr:MAG: hypothetical protein JSV09_01375 [Thermoplasmata archaeon]
MNIKISKCTLKTNLTINILKGKGFGQRAAKLVCALMLFVILIQIIPDNVNAQPILYSHHVVMIQGDDPETQEKEHENELHAIERFSFLIPWNESWVEVPVPKIARTDDMTLNQMAYSSSIGYFPGDFSSYRNPENPPYKIFKDMTDMECCIADFYAWGFPINSDRNLTFSIHLDSESDFDQYFDDVRSDDVWNFSDSEIKLKKGHAFGEYISIPSEIGINITKIESTWNVPIHEENFTFYISHNNGTEWHDIKGNQGKELNLTTSGNELIWKINMTQDISQNSTPVLTDFWINVTYTPLYNDIIMQLDYIIEKDSNKFEFVMDLYKDYEDGVTPHMLIYVEKDHTLKSSEIPLTLYGSQTEYPDKDVYIFMTGSFMPAATVSIEDVDDEEQFPWLLLLAIFLILLIIAILLVTSTRRREKEEPSDTIEGAATAEEIEKLELRKEGLLKAIKKLDKDFEEGLLDEETHKELKDSYKKKAAEVMKQMDDLDASPGINGTSIETSSDGDTILQEKENILKAIKKLDNDFNDDLIEEDVYKELRADYKRKAVEIMKELEKNH